MSEPELKCKCGEPGQFILWPSNTPICEKCYRAAQERARVLALVGRIDSCEEAIATGMETPGTRHSCFEWDEAHWYARKRLGLP